MRGERGGGGDDLPSHHLPLTFHLAAHLVGDVSGAVPAGLVHVVGEAPIDGVSSRLISDHLEMKDKVMVTKEGLLNWMKEHMVHLDKEFGEVIVMAGAGDIDELVKPVKEIIEKGQYA